MTVSTHTLFPAQDLADNQSKALVLDGKKILVCKSNGEYFAVDNRCTHQKSEFTGGRIRNCFLSCPLHGARFNLRTGQPLGELTRIPLKTYDVQVAGDGNLQLKMDEP